MGWTQQIQPIVDAIAKKQGRYDERTPKMRPSDMVAVLGLLSRSLANSIPRVATMGIQRSDFVTSDGLWRAPSSVLLIGTQDVISTEQYLFASVAPTSVSYKRTPTKLTDAQIQKSRLAGMSSSPTYEPARQGSYVRNDQLEQVTFLRGAIGEYQQALDRSSTAVQMYPLNQTASRDLCVAFMRWIRGLASSLDVMHENPPTTFTQDVKGALGYTLGETEKALETIAEKGGQVAGWVGNQVGKVAGSAVSGFLDAANLATLAVAGVVGYVAFQRYF